MPPLAKKPEATSPLGAKLNGANGGKIKKAKKEPDVRYPEARVEIFATPPSDEECYSYWQPPITVEQAKLLLDWETEKEYAAREAAKNPDLKESMVKLTDEDTLLQDEEGNKIACWNNNSNRPFRENHAKELAQEILNKRWKMNWENIIISCTGQLTSGQHRLIGLILAAQIWAGPNKARWLKKWPDEPTIESSVAFGTSDDPEVIQTLDNVLARSEADIFYLSPLFRDLTTKKDRKLCSNMLARCVDLLWRRTHAGNAGGTEIFKTHSASMEFVDRHMKVLDCVRNLFDINDGRVITNMRLSPGQCAAMMYLMGSSNSDGDEYMQASTPSEKKINWDRWDDACKFWALLVADDESMNPLKKALAGLFDEDTLSGGRTIEKLTTIAKAWAFFIEGQPFSKEDLQLSYTTNDKGQSVLTDQDRDTTFGGIDFGEPEKKSGKPIVDPDKKALEEAAQAKEAEREKRAKEIADKAKSLDGGDKPKDWPKLGSTATRKQIEAQQTAKAKAADEAKGKENPKAGTPKKPILRGGIG